MGSYLKNKVYIFSLLFLLVCGSILGITYSTFVYSSEDYRASEMYIGSLLYSIKINGNSSSSIVVSPGESEYTIKISSLNSVSSYYKLVYNENSNIKVEYSEESINLPSGSIDNSKEIVVKVTNNSSSNITVEFDVEAGYITNDLASVIVKDGYNEILDSYVPVSYITIYDKVLLDNPTIKNDSSSLFQNIADEASESGLFRTTDLTKTEGGKEVLYFRGVVENNYLVFAEQCWRIVRTNESGESIKLRYGGTPTKSGDSYECPRTGTEVKINNNYYFYNGSLSGSKYLGYVYDSNTSSEAKSIIDIWYTNNIASKGTSTTNLIIDEPYCNDTSVGSTSGIATYYGAYTRIETNKRPQYKCPNASDKYTVDATKGNGKLSKPIALLTIDEVVYAGGQYATANTSYYLYNGLYYYWTMSAHMSLGSSTAYMFYVDSNGKFDSFVNDAFVLLPVISLSNDALVSEENTGAYNNPYVIVVE